MSVPVYFWSPDPTAPHKGYWATTIIEDLANGLIWTPTHRFDLDVQEGKPESGIDGCVLIIPGRFESDEAFAEVQYVLNGLKWCLFIYVADEEQKSRWWDLKHNNIQFWVQAANVKDSDKAKLIPFGYTGHTRQTIKKIGFIENPIYDWSFSGQNTHKRRYELVDSLNKMGRGYLNTSNCFAGGLEPADYIESLCNSKVAPAPGGPVAVDSFRLAEALEAGCLVVADTYAGNSSGYGYWDEVFKETGKPFETARTWRTFERELNKLKLVNPAFHNAIWQKYKRQLAIDLHSTIHELSGLSYDNVDNLSFIVTTSPAPSHPSTDILEQTIDSIRFWHPSAEIVIVADGIRPQQGHLRESYNQYLRRLVWLTNHKWHNTLPVLLSEWGHQANATREALTYVQTDTFCFVEHDCPIYPDNPIDWDGCVRIVQNKDIDILRFHFETDVITEHRHLLKDEEPHIIDMVPVQRTMQWSQRPHISRTDYYRWMLQTYFPKTSRTMIEDKAHSLAQCDPELFDIAFYAPEGNKKRCGHLDARQSEPKFDMKFK